MLEMLTKQDEKAFWPTIDDPEHLYWVIVYVEDGQYKPVLAEASDVNQERYTFFAEALPEDLLTIFTTAEAAKEFAASMGIDFQREHADKLRFLSVSEDHLLRMLKSLDTRYEMRQNGFRVDICELRRGSLRRELLYSRQTTTH